MATCRNCGGSGLVYDRVKRKFLTCRVCHGTGTTSEEGTDR